MMHSDSSTLLRHQAKSASNLAVETVSVACAADDNYAKGLAVTLVSAVSHLHPATRLAVDLFDGGISNENRERLEQTCDSHGIDFRWRQTDLSRLRDLPVSHHVSQAAYLRLLLGDSLPDMKRVLYLDSDLLIRDDLTGLFNMPLGNHVCGAIPDGGCPVMDAWQGLSNVSTCGPYLSVYRPIRNYRQLGFQPEQPYFNSGVLLIDLDAWRQEKIADRALECLEKYRRYVWCWDQYALNVVLAGRWTPLPLRWNCGAHLMEYPRPEEGPFDAVACREAIEDPAIVHFTTDRKPWRFGTEHPYRDTFFATLDQTAWRGWRPSAPPFTVKRWVVSQVARLRKQAVISGRKSWIRVCPPAPCTREDRR